MTLDERVRMTTGCRDSDVIIKVSGAGRVDELSGERIQIMHNGLKVVADGYYGSWMTQIIADLRGHHEPQEELIFDVIARRARPDSTMIELGAYWCYYSMWYLNAVAGSRAICVEPDPFHLALGRRNGSLNGIVDRMSFIQAWTGGAALPDATYPCETTHALLTLPQFDVPGIIAAQNLDAVEVLHIDTQGAELPLIRSMRDVVGKLRFVCVSTHHHQISGSPTTHEDCLAAVRDLGGHILVEHPVHESFSGDGLIVASFSASDADLVVPVISRNTPEHSLFREA